jgi:aminoglycoside 2''-phosphotransferase
MIPNLQTRIERIKSILPQSIVTVQVHEGGEDFLVVEVNATWMFRFPRNPSAVDALAHEKAFLPGFARLSPLPVPEPQFVHLDCVGYRKIEGIPLTRRAFDTLTREARSTIARQMGEFLSVLHTFPLEEARRIGLTESWGGWRQRAYRSFTENVAPLLSTQARKNTRDFFDRFFALEWKRVVVHGDFYPRDHIFFDPARQELSGVIDFGDLTIEDAATDFKSILQDFGEGFLQEVVAHYTGEMDSTFLDRLKTCIRATPLFDAPYAIEYNQPERFRARVAEIERVFGADDVQ